MSKPRLTHLYNELFAPAQILVLIISIPSDSATQTWEISRAKDRVNRIFFVLIININPRERSRIRLSFNPDLAIQRNIEEEKK